MPHMPDTGPAAPLLQVTALTVHHGKLPAVHGLSLSLQAGQVGCLIGANGAGKSSTLNALAGSLPSHDGRIGGRLLFDGQDVTGWPAHTRLRAGIALVPEGRGILAQLSVLENLQLGAYARSDSPAVREDMERLLTRLPRIRERLAQQAGTLSGGEQQMLAIGRALLARPRLLLLDEPSMGLAPIMVEQVYALIDDIRQQGVTLLLVEQNAGLALSRADRAWVLESGRCVLEGSGSALRDHPAVRSAYLGEEAPHERHEDANRA